MDELEKMLWGWRADLCTCRSVSESRHQARCAAGQIRDTDLAALYFEVDLWHDDEMAYELEHYVLKSSESPTVPLAVVDDPE